MNVTLLDGFVLHALFEQASRMHLYLLPEAIAFLFGLEGLTIIALLEMSIRSSSIISWLSVGSKGSGLTEPSVVPGSAFILGVSILTKGDCQRVSVLQSGHVYLNGVHFVYLIKFFLIFIGLSVDRFYLKN